MNGGELDRLIVRWLEEAYPELVEDYNTTSLMMPCSEGLSDALDMFLELMGKHFPGAYVYYIPYELALDALGLTETPIPDVFRDAL